MRIHVVVAALAVAAIVATQAQTAKKRVLYLTHSAGYKHEVVPLSMQLLPEIGRKHGFDVIVTKDLSFLKPQALKAYDAVVFYTTGELPIADEDKANLASWIRSGHGFGGIHSATDTFYQWPEYGHIFDHFGLDFEYDNGVHMVSMCRQQPGTPGLVAEFLVGTNGTCDTQDGRRYEIKGPSAWKWEGEYTNPYQQEHTDLIASIRAGSPLNELRQVADSTLAAIAGREAAYTGKVISLEELMAAPVSIVPPKLEFGPISVPPVPIPGQSQTM